MGLRQLLSSASRFGHFATPGPVAAAAEDDTEESRRAKKAEDDEAARRAEEEEESRKARRSRKARKRKADREDGDDEDADEACDDVEEDDDDEEMKKAAAAGHDFALAAAFRAGARAQRRRCAAIFGDKAAAANPVLAMSLAFETSMTSDAAIAVLAKSPAPRSTLAGRMAGEPGAAPRLGPSAPEGPKGAAAIAAGWDVAMGAVAPKLPAR